MITRRDRPNAARASTDGAAMRFVPPMAALLVERLPSGGEWLYEAKFDGYRALAMKDGAKVKILSRKGNDLTADYPAATLWPR